MHMVVALSLALGVRSVPVTEQKPASRIETATQGQTGDQRPPDEDASQSNGAPDERHPDRIFGVLPNYTSVDDKTNVPPITTKQTLVMASFSSFDPYVFPFVAVVAGIAQATHQEASWGGGLTSYGRRYAMAFSDNTIGNFMTTSIMPAALHQDPRYFVLRSGSVLHRVGYAASRSIVTRTRTGGRAFNLSEIGGNTVAATISNSYHPAEDRTASNTVTRIGSQIMWDTLSNELKEFWPDIRDRLHHHARP